MKSFEITNHFSEFDRSILEGESAYEDYFEYIKKALNCLLSSFDTRTTELPLELEVIKDFSKKFLNTIDAFRLKYAFQENQSMLIDLTESSFPNFLEFKRLNDDIFSKKEVLSKLQSAESLKQLILDGLIQNKKEPKALLKQLSTVSYFEQLNLSKLFMEFTPGKLEVISESNDKAKTRRFFYSWGSYDSVTNRPYIYMAIFDNPTNTSSNNTDIRREENFIEAVKKITHNTAPLNVVASDLDAAYEAIYPKIVKRVDLGPLFGMYSKDDHEYTKILKDHFTEDDFILSYTTEVIFSIGEKRNKSFLSQGELRQIFHIDESNKECMERMVSKVHKYMISSHRVIQYLNENKPEALTSLAAPPYAYLK